MGFQSQSHPGAKLSPSYTLYLVTDSSPKILKGRKLDEVVKRAIEGGVTIVQYRDKSNSTSEMIRMAKDIHKVTQEHDVPLIINDRLDVALAVDAEGIHLGQDDMSIATFANLIKFWGNENGDFEADLGKRKIIGITVSNCQQAKDALRGGADYLGIGTMFATATKVDTEAIIGTSGTRKILQALAPLEHKIPTVAIGGINVSNVQRVMYQSTDTLKGLDGVAVVSAIVSAPDPKAAASELRHLMSATCPFSSCLGDEPRIKEAEQMRTNLQPIYLELAQKMPLCHNMTNTVVQNFAANVALAIGASPIMSAYGPEAGDLASLGGSLVINMGTVSPEGLENYLLALQAYNSRGAPVLLDPVGAGATRHRRQAVKGLLAGGFFDVIKGNEGEIRTILGDDDVQQRGVDSGSSNLTDLERARVAKKLAHRERNVVLLTGRTDYLSDGYRTVAIENGHAFLGRVTGSGCSLGTVVAAFLAAYRRDKLMAALAGILLYEIAAEKAAPQAAGPGTFIPLFIDALSSLMAAAAGGDTEWLSLARISTVDV